MGTMREPEYGDRPVKIYPVTESELDDLRLWAFMSLFLIGIPFLIVGIFTTVRRIKKETKFALSNGDGNNQ